MRICFSCLLDPACSQCSTRAQVASLLSTPPLTPQYPLISNATIVSRVRTVAFDSGTDLGEIRRDRETVTPTTIPVRSWWVTTIPQLYPLVHLNSAIAIRIFPIQEVPGFCFTGRTSTKSCCSSEPSMKVLVPTCRKPERSSRQSNWEKNSVGIRFETDGAADRHPCGGHWADRDQI